nr:DUF1176 domain-containing protein [Pseudomonas sp. BIGb0427]
MSAPLHAAFFSPLLALPGAAHAAAAEPVPLYQPLKDWVVGCDNTRQCTALAADTRADMPLGIQVMRGAGLDGQLQVTIFSNSSLEAPLQLDGQPLALPFERGSGGRRGVLARQRRAGHGPAQGIAQRRAPDLAEQ